MAPPIIPPPPLPVGDWKSKEMDAKGRTAKIKGMINGVSAELKKLYKDSKYTHLNDSQQNYVVNTVETVVGEFLKSLDKEFPEWCSKALKSKTERAKKRGGFGVDAKVLTNQDAVTSELKRALAKRQNGSR